ncbi:PTS sugar transporter subunit IIC [Streptococcus hyointestinalis]|uniref:PTS sugar transporter subunit IIC n=1 Tax=Streptococcus hyointestinalis TaxID=1337 RepID=UPI0013E085D5|nr:PTS sugar transporter subunit IIC [Streptococcus hyointestinalis]
MYQIRFFLPSFHRLRSLIFESLRDLFPFALLYAWMHIFQQLFCFENAFFLETTGFLKGKQIVVALSMGLGTLSDFLLSFLMGHFVETFMRRSLEDSTIDWQLPSLIGFLTTWLLFTTDSTCERIYYNIQPFWLLLVLFGLVIVFVIMLMSSRFAYVNRFLGILLLYGAYSFNQAAQRIPYLYLDFLLQTIFESLLGNGHGQLLSVLLWSVLATIMLVFGFTPPFMLNTPDLGVTVAGENITAALDNTVSTFPHLFTFYTFQDCFALFGGIGMLLALLISVLGSSRMLNNKRYLYIALLSAIPLLFDQQLPFFLGLPILFQPILLIPMVVSTVLAELLGALALPLLLLKPAVYATPVGTPSVLFGFLTSNGDWRYLVFTFGLLGMSIFIYRPFVTLAFRKEEKQDEMV